MTNRRGQEFTFGSIGIAVLVLITILVITPIFTQKERAYASTVQPLAYYQAYIRCTGLSPTLNAQRQCDITAEDKDGDCAPNKCDFCILADKGAGLSGDKLRQARGSNQCDYDKDGMPDACDVDPWKSKDSYCQRDMNGNCQESLAANQNMPPCKIPPFEVKPLP